jgi:hypothetical protein
MRRESNIGLESHDQQFVDGLNDPSYYLSYFSEESPKKQVQDDITDI